MLHVHEVDLAFIEKSIVRRSTNTSEERWSQEPPPLAGMDEKAEVVLTLEEAKGLDARTVDLRGGKDTGVKGQLVKVEDRAVGRVERCGAASHGHQACTLAGQAMSTNMLL